MKTSLVCLFALVLCTQNTLSAQTTNTWKGGAPGHETDWYFPKNWSAAKTPDEFDRVLIPDVSSTTRRYPIIRSGEVEVRSLEVLSGAMLTLLAPARLLTAEFECLGQCKGCSVRIWVEGTTKAATAAVGD